MKPIWIIEKEAAAKVNRKPKYFRNLVKSGKLDIAWTTINGRSYHYNEKDIDRLLMQNSSLPSR